jgi:hypothetical protein
VATSALDEKALTKVNALQKILRLCFYFMTRKAGEIVVLLG